MRSGPGAARTILLFHIISARPSKQPLMVRTFLKGYVELGSYFLFLQEQIKDIIISQCWCCCRGRLARAGSGSHSGVELWLSRTGKGSSGGRKKGVV